MPMMAVALQMRVVDMVSRVPFSDSCQAHAIRAAETNIMGESVVAGALRKTM